MLQPAGSAKSKEDSEIVLIYLLSLTHVIFINFLRQYFRNIVASNNLQMSISFDFCDVFDSSQVQHHRTLRFFRFLVLKGPCFLERALFSRKEACFGERVLSFLKSVAFCQESCALSYCFPEKTWCFLAKALMV